MLQYHTGSQTDQSGSGQRRKTGVATDDGQSGRQSQCQAQRHGNTS